LTSEIGQEVFVHCGRLECFCQKCLHDGDPDNCPNKHITGGLKLGSVKIVATQKESSAANPVKFYRKGGMILEDPIVVAVKTRTGEIKYALMRQQPRMSVRESGNLKIYGSNDTYTILPKTQYVKLDFLTLMEASDNEFIIENESKESKGWPFPFSQLICPNFVEEPTLTRYTFIPAEKNKIAFRLVLAPNEQAPAEQIDAAGVGISRTKYKLYLDNINRNTDSLRTIGDQFPENRR